MKLLFRPLRDSDHPAIFNFIGQITLAKKAEGFNWSEANLKSEFKLAECFVLENQGQAVAFASLRILAAAYELTCIAVDPREERKGWGHQMVAELIALKVNGAPGHAEEVWLEVHEKNHSARRLYSRFGFKVVGQRKNYYAGGGDALLMSLKLSR